MVEQLAEIVQRYGMQCAAAAPVHASNFCVNTIVTDETGERFFLKQYRATTSEARVQDIHASKHYFADAGIPVILPKRTTDGATFVTAQGRHYALFPFVAGTSYVNQRCSRAELEAVARMIACIHAVGERAPAQLVGEQFTRRSAQEAYACAEQVMRAIDAQHEPTPFDEMAARVVSEKQQLARGWNFDPIAQPLIVVHGDLHAGNAFFNARGDIDHIFDFELTKYAPASYDLVYLLTIVCFDYGTREEKLERARAFLAAYRSVRPMSDELFWGGVREMIADRLGSFWVEESHYLQGNDRFDRFLELDHESCKLWISVEAQKALQ